MTMSDQRNIAKSVVEIAKQAEEYPVNDCIALEHGLGFQPVMILFGDQTDLYRTLSDR